MPSLDLARAHDVRWGGDVGPTVLLAHGIGGTADDWGWVALRLGEEARTATFALAGSAAADPRLFSHERHRSILGFADDLAALVHALDIRGCVLVAHSLSAIAGAVAAAQEPGLFSRLVLINGTARYADDPASFYVGGFTHESIEATLGAIDADFIGWSEAFGKLMLGPRAKRSSVDHFTRSLRGLGPEVASTVLRAAFTCDFRQLVTAIAEPVMVVQSRNDPAVPDSAARWLARAIPRSALRLLRSEGHFPHLVDPAEVLTVIREFTLTGRV
jgi:sigma-B regulation protein RsbQ